MKNTVITTLHFEIKNDKALVKFVDMRLDLDRKLDERMYYQTRDLPNKNGFKVIQSVLIQGLISTIQTQHQFKQLDSAENLRFVISELERTFVQVTDSKIADDSKLSEDETARKICPTCKSENILQKIDGQLKCLNCDTEFNLYCS